MTELSVFISTVCLVRKLIEAHNYVNKILRVKYFVFLPGYYNNSQRGDLLSDIVATRTGLYV